MCIYIFVNYVLSPPSPPSLAEVRTFDQVKAENGVGFESA